MNSLLEVIQNGKTNVGSKVALQIKEDNGYFRVTYDELYQGAQKIAYSLRQFGIRKSDMIGIMTENSPFWGMAFFGILWVGAIVVPIDTKLKEHSVFSLVAHSGCKVIFVSSKFKDMIKAMAKNSHSNP